MNLNIKDVSVLKKGVVKWFNAAKGFGFIVYDGNDYFVNYRDIVGEGYKLLLDGDRVEFMPNCRGKGNWASNVRVLSASNV